jgi:hypothetical protein
MMKDRDTRNPSIDFKGIAVAALASAKSLLQEWLPGGRFEGREYVALNPTRNDRALGSFKINWQTGEWSDFADPNARGRDLISLFAYITASTKAQPHDRLQRGSAFQRITVRLLEQKRRRLSTHGVKTDRRSTPMRYDATTTPRTAGRN